MENKKPTIDDLLNSLKGFNAIKDSKLQNTKETWERIGSRDSFDELNLGKSELEDFLRTWIDENPYNNI